MAERLTAVTGPDGVTTYYSYATTTRGQTVTTTDGRRHDWVQEFWGGELAYSQDPLYAVTYYVYPQFLGAAGADLPFYGPIAVTDPTLRTSYYQYDFDGHQVAATNPLGETSYFQYEANRLTGAVDPLGQATYFGYDAYRQRVWQRDAAGAVRYWEYDAHGYVSAQVDPLGAATYFDYLDNGLTRAVQDARGQVSYAHYDQYGFVWAAVDALGQATYYEYDDAGRPTQITDAAGGVVQRGYSTAGNLTVQLDQLGRVSYFDYDANNRLVSATDPRGHTQYYGYDAVGNPVWARDALGAETASEYDAANRRTAVLDPLGNPTYYLYDAAGRQLAEVDAQGQAESVTYDLAGRVAQRDKASGVGAYYSYDAAGRVTTELRYPSGDAIYYEYDPRGAPTSVKKTGVPDETWEYDAAGRVVVNTQGSFSLYYGYDEVGNRTSMAFLGGGVAYFTYYEYDPRNLLAALTDPLGQTVYYERDALGREVAKLLPNGVTTYHAYDLAGQVTSIIHQGPNGVLQSLEYTYDEDGQRTRIVREDGTRIYFDYDAAHRLTTEDWLDPSDVHLYAFAYEYDAAGNRLKKSFNGEVTYYDYNNLNQLTTEAILGGDATYYTWTADGAMATKHDVTGWTYYTWDVDESLTQIAAPDVTLNNRYNARMQRVQREEDSEPSNLIYDAQNLIAEATEEGLTRYYLSEGGSVYSPLVSQLGSQHWQLFDALGTVLGLTADSGALSDTFRYEAFGTSLGRTGTTGTPYQYVGAYGYFDEPSVALEQVWWRWLAARRGGWQSRDARRRRGRPAYTYASASPVRLADPFGLQSFAPAPIREPAEVPPFVPPQPTPTPPVTQPISHPHRCQFWRWVRKHIVDPLWCALQEALGPPVPTPDENTGPGLCVLAVQRAMYRLELDYDNGLVDDGEYERRMAAYQKMLEQCLKAAPTD